MLKHAFQLILADLLNFPVPCSLPALRRRSRGRLPRDAASCGRDALRDVVSFPKQDHVDIWLRAEQVVPQPSGRASG
jgi:hypothetical protein